MMTGLDATHDPRRISWIDSANQPGGAFPIQNLPFGVIRRAGEPAEAARGAVAIGDQLFDLAAAVKAGLFAGEALVAAHAASGATLNPLMALPPRFATALRQRVSDLLCADGAERARMEVLRQHLLAPIADAELMLPAQVGDYTDFYASSFHATAVGRMFRPDAPLLPNYKWVPIGYHGRASSVRPSGVAVRRPVGQTRAGEAQTPRFGPCAMLDYELELGAWIGPGNAAGDPIAIERAADHLFGVCLLNDWSARDIQAWEYQPLGPFLAKSFATTVSPWIVTADALAPFRIPAFARPAGDPAPLPYLFSAADQETGGFAIAFEVLLSTAGMRAAGVPPARLSQGDFRTMYWTLAQLIAHHASNGCNLRPGDLIGSGTISGPTPESAGSLLELAARGARPVMLPNGEARAFLEDGDEIVLRAEAARAGFVAIGFGECRARVVAAPAG